MREVGGDDMGQWIPAEQCFNWENMALGELARGRQEAADDCARRSEKLAAAIDLRLPTTLARRTRAAVLLADGDAPGAARAAEESISAAEAIGAGLEVGFSRNMLGRALAAAGERPRAIEVLRQAERDLDSFGSVRMRDEARRELRKLGRAQRRADRPRPGTPGSALLSKRELEVAELITDRMTNQEIAEKLFLSKKTVESHIRNVFAKLGASSRVEVARVVEREQRGDSG